MLKSGIVVPTRGDRTDYLTECLSSIQAAGYKVVIVVAPERLTLPHLSNVLIRQEQDTGEGAASAINIGLKTLIEDEQCKIVGWLGDDDSLEADSLVKLAAEMDASSAVAAVGYCRYVDEIGSLLHTSRPRKVTIRLLEYWSNGIPQPGSIFSADALKEVGYLDERLKYAFDQDLFHKLKKKGPIAICKSIVSTYRWHPFSLSSAGRVESAEESQMLRLSHGHWAMRPFTRSWFSLYKALSRILPSTLP